MKCLMPGGINAIHDLFAMQVFLSAFISFVKSRALLFLINNDLRLGVLLDGFLVFSEMISSYNKNSSKRLWLKQ